MAEGDSLGPLAQEAAELRFHNAHGGASGGRLVLYSDRTIRLEPSGRLIDDLELIMANADQTVLKWGASLVVGLSAVGATCVVRGRRAAGFGLLAAAGLSGVGAAALRRVAQALVPMALSPQPIDRVDISRDPETGIVRFALAGGGAGRNLVVHLLPDDYDTAEAAAFLYRLTTFQKE